jgi:hypothetical protein
VKDTKARIECQSCDWKTEWLTPDEAEAVGRDHDDQKHKGVGDFLTITDDPPTHS